MLRLEQARKDSPVNITVRQKEPFFNRLFLAALLTAVGMHLFGILLFHIAPFKVNYSDSLFPPVAVASDLGRPFDGHTLASVDDEVAVPSYLLLPATADLSIAPLPSLQAPKPLEYLAVGEGRPHPFLAEELACLQHGCVLLAPETGGGVKIHISGALADLKLPVDVATLPSMPLQLRKQGFRLSFDVQVDGRSGAAVWLQPRETASKQAVRWGEEVVKGLRFAPSAGEVAVIGRVEISFSPQSGGG